MIHIHAACSALGDAEHLSTKTRNADEQHHAEDDGVFGLALNANAVGALNVTTNNGPDDTSGEN